MAWLLQKRIALLAVWLSVLAMAASPLARASDIADVKNNLATLLTQVQGIESQMASLSYSLAADTNNFNAQIYAVRVDLAAVKNSLDAKNSAADTVSPRRQQFIASLQSLSNNIVQLASALNEIKTANAAAAQNKTDLARQMTTVTGQIESLASEVKSLRSSVESVVKNETDRTGEKSGDSGDSSNVVLGYVVPGLSAATLLLCIITLLIVRAKLSSANSKIVETRNTLARFGAQFEERVKAMDGSSASVQNVAKDVNQVLSKVETAVQNHLQAVSKQLNSAQLTELAGSTNKAAEQLGQLRAEASSLHKFMGELQDATQRWAADFEKQTSHSLNAIKTEAHSLDHLLWPDPFLADDKLGPARQRIMARATAGDKTAFGLMLALGEFQLAISARGGDNSRAVEALDRVGQLAYAFWREEPGASVENSFESAQAWGGEINKLLTAHNVPLSIRVIMPRGSFDMSTMLSEQSLTGATSRVREALSWAVIGKDSDRQKVLVTGKVITE